MNPPPPPNFWSPVRHASHYTKWAGCEWQARKSFHYPTVMVDWFHLNSANSSNLVNLIQNRKNATVFEHCYVLCKKKYYYLRAKKTQVTAGSLNWPWFILHSFTIWRKNWPTNDFELTVSYLYQIPWIRWFLLNFSSIWRKIILSHWFAPIHSRFPQFSEYRIHLRKAQR